MKLKCQDCGAEFEFSERDQKFYEEQGYVLPKRCRILQRKKKR